MDLIEATRLAKGMMADHGLVGWRFEFDNAVKRLGSCQYHKKLITMSRKFVSAADQTQVRETMLHEIAHALCPAREGHGPLWKAKYRAIGGTGGRTATNPYLADPVAAAAVYRWVGTCPAGHKSHRSQRPTRVFACSKCSKVFSRANVLSWTYDGRPMAPQDIHPKFAAEWVRIFGTSATSQFLAKAEKIAAQNVAVPSPETVAAAKPWRPKVGDVVRISTVDLRYLGKDLVVWKVGPKRAHFQVDGNVLMVPFDQIIPIK